MFRFIAGIIILIIGKTIGTGMEMKNLQPDSSNNITTNLILMVGLPLALSADEFSKDYKHYLEGHTALFKSTPLLSLNLKIPVNEHLNTSYSFDYFTSYFNDNFSQATLSHGRPATRWISENFEVTSYPFLGGIDYFPGEMPYKSYTGASVGLTVTDMNWKETVNTEAEDDKRTGGEHIKSTFYNPTLRIVAGLELDFDRNSTRDFLNSFIAEARFTYTYRYVKLFEDLKGEDEKFNEILQNTYAVLPFCIGLYIGLSLNIGYL